MKTSTTAATKCPRRSSFYFILCMAVLSISSVCAGHEDALLNPPNDNDDNNNQNQEVFSTLITRGSNTDADMTANPNHLPKIDDSLLSLGKGTGIGNGCWIAAVEVLLVVLFAGCLYRFTANIRQYMCMTTLVNYCKHGSLFRATLAKMLTLVVLLSIVGQSSVVAIESIDIETTQQDDLGWDNTSPEDTHPPTGNRVSNSSPQSIIERLNEMKRNDSLRGSQKAAVFSELRETAKSKLLEVRALSNGNEDFDIKRYLESTASESKALQKLQGQAAGGIEDLSGLAISPKELSKQFNMIQKQSGIDIEAAVEHTLHLLEDNESYFLSQDDSQDDSQGRRLNSDQEENQQERTKLNFNPHVGTSPRIHDIIRQAHSEGRKHMRHAHKQKSNVKTSDRRRHLEESGVCPIPCALEDRLCNCKKLHACASEISSYDLSVMYLNGYIEDDGNVTTTPLNLFDANIPQKMADIDEILLAWNPEEDDSTSCKALLQKFHVPCKSDTCSTTNDRSYQLTIDEVCTFVGTPTKVLMSAIENTLDDLTSSDQLDQLEASIVQPFLDYLDAYVVDKWGMNGSSYKDPTFITDGKLPSVISGNDHAEVYFYKETLSTNSWSHQKQYCVDRGKRLCTLEEIFPIRTYYGSARAHVGLHNTNKNIGDFPYHTYSNDGIWRNENIWVAYETGYTQLHNRQGQCPNSSWVQAGTWNNGWTGWDHAELLIQAQYSNPNYCATHAPSTGVFNKGIVCCDDTQVSLRAVEEGWNGQARADTRTSPIAQKVKIHHPDGNSGYIELIEVQVFDEDGNNRAVQKPATQSSTYQNRYDIYSATYAVDGSTSGYFTHTGSTNGAYWQVDLGTNVKIKEIRLYLRNNSSPGLVTRLDYAKVSLLSQSDDLVAMYNLGNIPGKQSSSGQGRMITIHTKTGIMEADRALDDDTVIEYLNGGRISPPIAPPTIDPALKGTSSECSSVSFDICKQFILQFDKIYQGRNEMDYPLGNPMLGNGVSSANLSEYEGQDIFNHVNMPTSYSHSQDDHGVKTLNGYVNADLDGFPGEQAYINGIWTMKQDKNWARCSVVGSATTFGYNYGCGTRVEELADSTKLYNVKCCSDTLSDKFQTRHSSLTDEKLFTCPYHLVDNEQCPGLHTHEDAVDYCESKGGRLCSSEEIRNGCVKTGGCEQDLIWTAYTYEFSVKTECYNAQFDATTSNKAMKICDASMALLAGQLSVGALGNIAKALEDEGPSAMPGSCCLDTPSDSQYLGQKYDPTNTDMECRNKGPWHLGLTAEACENGGGKYSRSPCIRLQECIQNRPGEDDPGFIRAFEDWVRGTRPEGTCSSLAANATQIKCQSDDDCSISTTNSSSSSCNLEDWSGGFAIDDATDEDQCKNARQTLGFDQEYNDDFDVCEEFQAYKCDNTMFEELDELLGDPTTPTYKSISFTPPEYPPLEDLPFTKLPVKEDTQIPSNYKDTDREANWKTLNVKQRDADKQTRYLTAAYEAVNDLTIGCDALGSFCSGPPVPPNPVCFATQVCYVAVLIASIILFITRQVAEVAYLSLYAAYDDGTVSPSELYDGVLASEATLDNLLPFIGWNVESLGTINVNMIQQHMQMTTVLAEQHEALEIRLNTYMMCMTNHLGISMLKMTYPSAKVEGLSSECLETLGLEGDGRRRRLRALEEVEEGGDVPSQAPSTSEMPSEVPTLPDVFRLQLTFPDGTSISSDPLDVAESEEESNGSEPATASMHEMIKQIYESMIVSTSNGSNSSPLNDSFVSDSNAQWYVDWKYFICVQDCDEESGTACGGFAANHEHKYLRDTMKGCCEDNMGWEPVGKCIAASKKHSQTTRRLLDDDRQKDKRVVTGMHEMLKKKIGKVEDTINANGKALGDASKVLEGRIAAIEGEMKEANMNGKALGDAIEGKLILVESKMEKANMNGKALEGRIAVMEDDMKEMKGDMKELKDLLMQLVGINNVETKTKE